MNVQPHQQPLYFLLAVVSIGLFTIALGPGLFHQPDMFGYSWQHRFFDIVCHQMHDRSYSLHGASLAVCSRCTGIYGGFALAVLLLPVVSRHFTVINSFFLKLIVASIVVNLLDVLGNHIGIWTNTLHSRFLLGAWFGVATALFLTTEFFKQTHKTEEDYGK
ncbi:MAG: DUF2085 domain-containing protein [Balneola sp.]|nr:MAG: DUF2085 domain-containing protein [Balneola sp.]